MTLAPFVQALGRGPGRSRSLTESEAHEVMHRMLSGTADPHAVGAILMLLRMKGEVPDEIAGFARAAQQTVSAMPEADVDWPCYAAGRTRGLPWFLLAAKLVAQSGRRILLHGSNGADQTVRSGLRDVGIVVACDADDATQALDDSNIVYVPLEKLSPPLFELLNLRAALGLRSCINTVARMLNPGRAPVCLQGVFHPSYRMLQVDAARALGAQSLSVIKGGGGEFERHPGKAVEVFGLRNGADWQSVAAALSGDARRLTEGPRSLGALQGLWEGTFQNAFATNIVLGTAELAFDAAGESKPCALAQHMWAQRRMPSAAKMEYAR